MKKLLCTLLLLTTAAQAVPHGMVVSDNAQATDVGVAVLKQGGNAVDAAVAVATTLAVTFPEAGNLGGGGFMLIRRPDGTVTSIDFRETAPARTTRSMYYAAPQGSIVGYRAVGIPGTPAGLEYAWRKYGTRKLTWSALLLPAFRLAENGYTVPPGLAKDIAASHQLEANPEAKRIFSGVHDGDTLRQPELAATLLRLSRSGADDFYRGETARRIVRDMAAHHGLLTAADLAGYQAVERKPVEGTYRGYRILSMPPPSSGGAILLEMLNMVEAWTGGGMREHILVEVMRRAFADRATYFGDPDFVSVPLERLLSKDYARARVADINPDHATPEVKPGQPPREPMHTTHFSIVDADGGAVSCTYTLNNSFGSGVVARGTGVLLNDEMDDFQTGRPGQPNMFGLVQSEKNAVAPKHRPLSSMTPTLVLRPDGRLYMVLGSPGGPTIITAVFQVILHVIDDQMDLAAAITAPRLHHQWLPDKVQWEPGIPTDLLAKLGHPLAGQPRKLGDVKAILIQPDGTPIGFSDPRRSGTAAGY